MNNETKIRVLIVDDSPLVCKIISQLLSFNTSIEVIGEAHSGQESIEKSLLLQPDVITMDFQMPDMNGAEAISKILARAKVLPKIIMLSAYTTDAADETFQCLRAGAVDFVRKPGGQSLENIHEIQEKLIRKIIIAASNIHVQQRNVLHFDKEEIQTIKAPKRTKPIRAITIGTSTGGCPIIEDIIGSLPKNLNCPIFINQDLPQQFTEKFIDRLSKITTLNIQEIIDGQTPKPGTCYITPVGKSIQLKNIGNVIEMHSVSNKENPIDHMMLSVKEIYKEDVLGIALTGIGSDGVFGLKEIFNSNGHVIVQDLTTTVIDTFPRHVIENNIAHEILAPRHIPQRILQLTTIT